jgi:hypothetical protein
MHRRFGQFEVAGPGWEFMLRKVIAELEIRIIFQRRVREVEWGEHQTLPVTRKQTDAALEMPYQPFKLHLALEGLENTKMKRAVPFLVVQERSV